LLTLEDSIEIDAPSGAIEEWLLEIDEHYAEWHPGHVKWVNLDGSLDEGKTFYYEEYLHGRPYRSRCRITRLTRGDGAVVEFKGLSVLDRVLGIRGSFVIEPLGERSRVTATICLRFGRLIRALAGGIVRDLERHMAEEGESLKKIMES
jgi:hypothetical protein